MAPSARHPTITYAVFWWLEASCAQPTLRGRELHRALMPDAGCPTGLGPVLGQVCGEVTQAKASHRATPQRRKSPLCGGELSRHCQRQTGGLGSFCRGSWASLLPVPVLCKPQRLVMLHSSCASCPPLPVTFLQCTHPVLYSFPFTAITNSTNLVA